MAGLSMMPLGEALQALGAYVDQGELVSLVRAHLAGQPPDPEVGDLVAMVAADEGWCRRWLSPIPPAAKGEPGAVSISGAVFVDGIAGSGRTARRPGAL